MPDVISTLVNIMAWVFLAVGVGALSVFFYRLWRLRRKRGKDDTR